MKNSLSIARVALTFVLFQCLFGCVQLDLKDAALNGVKSPVGVTQTKSMGETMLTKYTCPCYEYYETTEEIRFNNYKPAARGSEWIVRYVDSVSKEKYLVNESFHPALVLILTPAEVPTLRRKDTVRQMRGYNEGRTWSLSDARQVNAIRFGGYSFRGGKTWRLQYIGPDKDQSQVLRFTVDDLGDNRERVGHTEYVHDLRKGNEFVIRGVRIRVNEASLDGVISYVVVADGEQ